MGARDIHAATRQLTGACDASSRDLPKRCNALYSRGCSAMARRQWALATALAREARPARATPKSTDNAVGAAWNAPTVALPTRLTPARILPTSPSTAELATDSGRVLTSVRAAGAAVSTAGAAREARWSEALVR